MIPVIDMHCDTVSLIMNEESCINRSQNTGAGDRPLRENSRHIDLVRMKNAGYMCQAFALYTDKYAACESKMTPFEYAMKLNEVWDREISDNRDLIRPVITGTDIERNHREGYMSALKTVEEGLVYEGSIERLKLFYEMGVRMSTLTWNYENELGFPNTFRWISRDGIIHYGDKEALPDENSDDIVSFEAVPDRKRGLKDKGFEFVRAMEELGMIIDVSHLSDAGIYDILETVRPFTPVIASHSNSRAVASHPRNLTDDMLRKIGEHGGVAGINFCEAFLTDETETGVGYVKDVISHMLHMKDVGGIDVIGLGSDFDGIDNVMEFGSCEGMQLFAERLAVGGFSYDEVDRIFYKNVLRVMKEVLG